MNREIVTIEDIWDLNKDDPDWDGIDIDNILNPHDAGILDPVEEEEKRTGFKFIEEESEELGIGYGITTVIVQRLSDLKFFKGSYNYVREDHNDYNNETLIEVFPQIIMTTIYK